MWLKEKKITISLGLGHVVVGGIILEGVLSPFRPFRRSLSTAGILAGSLTFFPGVVLN